MTAKAHLTPQRRLVQDFVIQATNHPTATEVIEGLREQGHKVAYATVYNSLRYLTSVGLLNELNFGNAVTRYDARTDMHYHSVCRACGRIDDWTLPLPQEYLKYVEEETRYKVEDVDLVVKGVCPACAGAGN